MSEFLKSISESEIDQLTTKGGKKKAKNCTALDAQFAMAAAACLALHDSCNCGAMRSLSELINKLC